jgi:hypothetical protein
VKKVFSVFHDGAHDIVFGEFRSFLRELYGVEVLDEIQRSIRYADDGGVVFFQPHPDVIGCKSQVLVHA